MGSRHWRGGRSLLAVVARIMLGCVVGWAVAVELVAVAVVPRGALTRMLSVQSRLQGEARTSGAAVAV